MGEEPTTSKYCYPFGVDASTGQPLLPRLDLDALTATLGGTASAAAAEENPGAAALRAAEKAKREQHLALLEGVSPTDLASAGWVVVFAAGADPAIRTALEPLLALRREQAGTRFRIIDGANGYRAGETGTAFLERVGGGRIVDPEKLPYYVLIVGSPDAIPYHVEHVLAALYAVGRVNLATPQAYARYANAVAAHERTKNREQRLDFFAPQNPNDGATPLSRAQLVEPLAARFGGARTALTADGAATKPALRALWKGGGGPRLLMTASHGLSCPLGMPRQRELQGALVSQEWDRKASAPIESYAFGGDDLDETLDPTGTVAFLFGCYTAGTPQVDRNWLTATAVLRKRTLADAPFVSHLARSALGHARPALAVVGHIDRTFCSVFSRAGESSVGTFGDFVERVRRGEPVGHAMRGFLDDAAADLRQYDVLQDQVQYGVPPDRALAQTWLQQRDASGFTIVGDPAVRLVPAT
jgi:hypothetical protein